MKTQIAHSERSTKRDAAVRGRALIDDWRRSGLSRSAYARQHHVGAHLLSYWFKRLRDIETAPEPAMAPVSALGFVEVSLPAPGAPSSASASSAVEILFPRGVAVRIRSGVDLDLLRSVITVLERSPC
jgi:transposase-like protein